MTAHGMCGRFEIFESARHFRIEFESGRPIRIRIESRSFGKVSEVRVGLYFAALRVETNSATAACVIQTKESSKHSHPNVWSAQSRLATRELTVRYCHITVWFLGICTGRLKHQRSVHLVHGAESSAYSSLNFSLYIPNASTGVHGDGGT